jgi:hypothetical protein
VGGTAGAPYDFEVDGTNAELIKLAEELKYSKIERLKAFSKNITADAVNDILRPSI